MEQKILMLGRKSGKTIHEISVDESAAIDVAAWKKLSGGAQPVNLVEGDKPVRMPWKMACGLACYAMIHKMTFDQVAAMALRAKVNRRGRMAKS